MLRLILHGQMYHKTQALVTEWGQSPEPNVPQNSSTRNCMGTVPRTKFNTYIDLYVRTRPQKHAITIIIIMKVATWDFKSVSNDWIYIKRCIQPFA